jgi:hypothetical protein
MGISLGFSRELSSLAYLMSGDRVTLGKTGELYAKILFDAHGYLSEIDHQRLNGDLRVCTPSGVVMRVEVKAARVGKGGYYQFCLTRRTRTGYVKTSCRNCDAVVLLGITASGRVEIYVLPAKAVQDRAIIKIPAKTGGKSQWRKYRQHPGAVNLNEIEGLRRDLTN